MPGLTGWLRIELNCSASFVDAEFCMSDQNPTAGIRLFIKSGYDKIEVVQTKNPLILVPVFETEPGQAESKVILGSRSYNQ